MNVIKKILNLIFNPLNNASFGKSTDKIIEFFTKHPILIFVTALLVSAIIYLCGYNFFLGGN